MVPFEAEAMQRTEFSGSGEFAVLKKVHACCEMPVVAVNNK
jgi:hypothetical protein